MRNLSLCRFLCVVLAVLCLCGALPQVSLAANPSYDAFRKRYDIAIVFDNSGSMYINTERWCRAKYAMEIFASMLHYENGDMLTIFPMWPTVCDGSQPTDIEVTREYLDTVESITVRNKEDIDKISNIYTVYASQTPYEPVEEAYRYLQTSDSDEKWLVILSDGAFNLEKRTDTVQKELSKTELQKRLEEMASESIKVQYLGFGSSKEIDEKRAQYLYTENSSDADLREKLVGICNEIFQRSDLLKQAPAAFDETTGKLMLDMSMRSLIVFAQGENAVIRSLKNETGGEVSVTLDSGQRTYSKIAAGNCTADEVNESGNIALVDTTLAGQVVTFADCAAGTYTLDVSGQTELQIFYEPNVEIAYSFTGDDGEVYNSLNEVPVKEILPGEYIIDYWIADSVTHEDVTNSPLLGSNVAFTAEVEYSNDEITKVKRGESLTLEPEQSVFLKITGKYLDQYRITTEDDRDNATLYVTAPEKETLALTLTQTQPHEWYRQDDWAEWEPIRAELTLSGRSLTDEQLAAVTFNTEFDGDEVSCQFRMLAGESAYEILLSRDGTGAYAEAKTGERAMTVKASFTDEYDRKLKAEDSVGFRIEPLGFWTVTLIVLAVIAAAVLLWLIFMLQKVMPKNIERVSRRARITLNRIEVPVVGMVTDYNRADKTLKISGGNAAGRTRGSITLVLRPVDNRFTPSARRRVRLTGLRGPSIGLTEVVIDGQRIRAAEFGNPLDVILYNSSVRLVNNHGAEVRQDLNHI